MTSVDEIVGRAVPNVTDWQYLNLNYVAKAKINQDCAFPMRALFCRLRRYQPSGDFDVEDRVFEVIDEECVACNLCVNVCPVEDCITMEPMPPGLVDPRTGKVVQHEYANWTTHPNNPGAAAAE